MNTGVVSARYAKALLLLVQETGNGERVFEQVRSILDRPSEVPASLENELERLVLLLRANNRMDCLKFVLRDFVRLYCRQYGICLAHLSSAVPSEDLSGRLRSILSQSGRTRVIMEESLDPSLIGGFVLDLEDYRLDASVSRQIEDIRRQLVQKNNRIV